MLPILPMLPMLAILEIDPLLEEFPELEGVLLTAWLEVLPALAILTWLPELPLLVFPALEILALLPVLPEFSELVVGAEELFASLEEEMPLPGQSPPWQADPLHGSEVCSGVSRGQKPCHAEFISASNKIKDLRDPETSSG